MRFAPVLPGSMYPLCDFGHYHLVNADRLEDPEARRTIDRWMQSSEHTVILDNGAAEHGKAKVEELFTLASYMKPDIIVCPDIPLDSEGTIQLALDHLGKCKDFATTMIVPQGRSLTEWASCLHHLIGIANEMHVNYMIGVTKFIEPYEGCRYAALALIDEYVRAGRLKVARGIAPEVHLLGCMSFHEFVRYAANFPWVRGCDSSYPFTLATRGFTLGGYHGSYMQFPVYDKTDMTEDLWKMDVTPQLIATTSINIAVIRQRLRTAQLRW